MKKFLTKLIIVAIAITFVSCNRGEKVKKLPSKIIYHDFVDSAVIWDWSEFFYDEQNRLIRVIKMGKMYESVSWEFGTRDTIYPHDDTLNIIYNSVGLPVKLVFGSYDYEIAYLNNGKKIVILDDNTTRFNFDTIWLNDKGQVIKSYDNVGHLWEHTYNSKGNISVQRHYGQYEDYEDGQYYDYEFINKVTHSRIRSVFRHVNTPDWFMFWLSKLWLNNSDYFHPFEKKGYLPLEKKYFDKDGKHRSARFIYELDTDNYVKKTKIKVIYGRYPDDDMLEWDWEYEYILAK